MTTIKTPVSRLPMNCQDCSLSEFRHVWTDSRCKLLNGRHYDWSFGMISVQDLYDSRRPIWCPLDRRSRV